MHFFSASQIGRQEILRKLNWPARRQSPTHVFYFNRAKVITAQILYTLHIKPKIEGKMPHLLSRKGSNCYIST